MRVITTSNSSAMLFKLNSSLMRGKNLLEKMLGSLAVGRVNRILSR